jgi:hypothetical protein
MKSIPEMSTETLLLKDYFNDAPDGAIITYTDMENRTGIRMDVKGKQRMRSALRSLRREFACIHGHGIEIESAHNALSLVNNRLIKVDNAVKRGEKTSTRMTKYLSSMDNSNRERLLHVVSIFGAIKASAELAREQYNKRRDSIIKISN